MTGCCALGVGIVQRCCSTESGDRVCLVLLHAVFMRGHLLHCHPQDAVVSLLEVLFRIIRLGVHPVGSHQIFLYCNVSAALKDVDLGTPTKQVLFSA